MRTAEGLSFRFRIAFCVTVLLLCVPAAHAQLGGREQIIAALEKDGCATLDASKVKVCKYDFTSNGQAVEAISFRPLSDGPFPALLLIPGYSRTARDYLMLGMSFAREGFACVAVTQPGFGKSEGKADYVGPDTIRVLTEAYRKFQREPFVDARRMGIYGYSRGAMAASLMAVQVDDVRAAVLGAGVYDFKKAYDEIKIAGIRRNMEAETGMTEEAIRQRSSILQMEKLRCPVLILHGEKDMNVPVTQAYLLRDRLTALKACLQTRTGESCHQDTKTPSRTKKSTYIRGDSWCLGALVASKRFADALLRRTLRLNSTPTRNTA